jgi:hypothetical protein
MMTMPNLTILSQRFGVVHLIWEVALSQSSDIAMRENSGAPLSGGFRSSRL